MAVGHARLEIGPVDVVDGHGRHCVDQRVGGGHQRRGQRRQDQSGAVYVCLAHHLIDRRHSRRRPHRPQIAFGHALAGDDIEGHQPCSLQRYNLLLDDFHHTGHLSELLVPGIERHDEDEHRQP